MKVYRIKYLAISVLLLLLVGTGVVASADIVNGTFNTPSSSSGVWGPCACGLQTVDWTAGGQYAYDPTNISGWTFTGGAGIQQNGSAWGFSAAPNGAGQSAFLQAYTGNYFTSRDPDVAAPVGPPSSISQTLSGLTVGDTYYLNFYLEERGGFGLDPVTVTIGGLTFVPVTPDSTSWSYYSAEFTATSSSELLIFAANFPNGYSDNDTGLADVSLEDAGGGTPLTATPEPGTLLLLGTGLLGLACAAFRKARSADRVLFL